MNYHHRSILFFLLFVPGISFFSRGQALNSFNININNGLPSDHVYGVIADKFGYLWAGTEKGVVKYNGYECKTFTLSDGLPTDDVWQLVEDKKGKIWLGDISDEIGYIYNNKYHKAAITGKSRTIYPKGMTAYNEGVTFVLTNINDSAADLCVSDKDSVYAYAITENIMGAYAKRQVYHGIHSVHVYHSTSGNLFLIYNNGLYSATSGANKLKIRYLFSLTDGLSPEVIMNNKNYIISDHLISFDSRSASGPSFISLDLNTGKSKIVNINQYGLPGNIDFIYYDPPGSMFLISDKHISAMDETNQYIPFRKTPITDFIPDTTIGGSKIRSFHKDKFWGNCVGTITNGLWINSNEKNNFVAERSIDLHNCKYLGGITDTVNFWWDQTLRKLVKIDKDLTTTCYELSVVGSLAKIIPYNPDTMLILGDQCYWYIRRTNELRIKKGVYFQNVIRCIKEAPGDLYAITISGFHHFVYSAGKESVTLFDKRRYRGLAYDSLKKSYWAYNSDNIFIHSKERDTLISKKGLSVFGIKKVENIIFDGRYGNVILKGSDNISLFDQDKKKYTQLFTNTNLKGANVLLYKGTLIVSGLFGVLFSKITGPLKVSPPVIYANLKSINYNFIYDCQASSGTFLFNTDKGIYRVKIPSDSILLEDRPDKKIYLYKFIMNYGDSIFDIRNNDTLNIDQRESKLQFDVINPYGNGKVKYMYLLGNDSVWHDLNSNELNLPALGADRYYGLSVVAYDNIWKSDPLTIELYVFPYWWQTYTGKRLLWSSIIILVLLLFTIAIVITRKIVLRTAKQKNLRMEMELKSIYAQINPHFIFNSLNSALLLVSRNKMADAYDHISKFSRLLRAYIKSSRNKYITVSEEANNLRDYLELQQVRFKNKFSYEIIYDPGMDLQSILIPSLLLQPFVENAINHGILQLQDQGHLKIEFRQDRALNEITCIIDDNGIGRKQSRAIKEQNLSNKNLSYGDLLIKDLVSIFNQYENMNINIVYKDKETPETGTTVTIQIKNPHHDK